MDVGAQDASASPAVPQPAQRPVAVSADRCEVVVVVAIDGLAGSGKSTLARSLAERLGVESLDTGAMYRAVTFAVLRFGGDPSDARFCTQVARNVEISVDGANVVVDGMDASVEVRGPAVTAAVSEVAAHPQVRLVLAARQRDWVAHRGEGVLEGRDIGTVVCPEADLKIHLVADALVRARRLVKEPQAGAVESLAADLNRRDNYDSSRSTDPLSIAEGAVVIDTSSVTPSGLLEKVMGLL